MALVIIPDIGDYNRFRILFFMAGFDDSGATPVMALVINIKLYGECKKYAPGDQTDFTLRLEPGATLSDVLHQLSIPQDSYVSLVNGRRAAQDVTLTEGDTLVVFPPVSGG